MNIGSVNVSTRSERAVNEKCCPECGARMVEVDRCNENGSLFVWYQCSKNNCEGQWLQKNPQGFLRLA